MIPNFAPMAAVFLRKEKTVSLPVAAWSSEGAALVPALDGTLRPAASGDGYMLLGLWPGNWSPSQTEMASLLPEHTPGTPHPLSVPVKVVEIPGGWRACRSDNGVLVAEATTLSHLEHRLSVLGNYRFESVTPASDY